MKHAQTAAMRPAMKTKSSERGSACRAKAPRTLLPDGVYEAQAMRIRKVPFFSDLRIYLELRLVNHEGRSGETVWAVFKHYDQPGPRSKFYKAWSISAGRQPRKGELLSADDLLGHIFKIRCRTVDRDEDGDPYPDALKYSVAKIIGLSVRNYRRQTRSPHLIPCTDYQLPTSPSGEATVRGDGQG